MKQTRMLRHCPILILATASPNWLRGFSKLRNAVYETVRIPLTDARFRKGTFSFPLKYGMRESQGWLSKFRSPKIGHSLALIALRFSPE